MNKSFYTALTLMLALVVLSSCRTDQALFEGAVYNGGVAVIGAIIGIFYALKKIL